MLLSSAGRWRSGYRVRCAAEDRLAPRRLPGRKQTVPEDPYLTPCTPRSTSLRHHRSFADPGLAGRRREVHHLGRHPERPPPSAASPPSPPHLGSPPSDGGVCTRHSAPAGFASVAILAQEGVVLPRLRSRWDQGSPACLKCGSSVCSLGITLWVRGIRGLPLAAGSSQAACRSPPSPLGSVTRCRSPSLVALILQRLADAPAQLFSMAALE